MTGRRETKPEGIVWTEGKTDWKHLKRAYQSLGIGARLDFRESDDDMGDDKLLKQCRALAQAPQTRPTIFVLDRDNDEIIDKVEEPGMVYKAWGNNVYSFALPVPDHRQTQSGICIEFYYTDDELRTCDTSGRRLFVSSEFNLASGRHRLDPRLSLGRKGPALGKGDTVRIVDSEVYDEKSENVALSKSAFATNVLSQTDAFAHLNFETFRPIFAVIEDILERDRKKIDLLFGDFDNLLEHLETLDKPNRLGVVLRACIRVCKLTAMTLAAAAIRYYDQAALAELGIDEKRLKPVRLLLRDQFSNVSLGTLLKLARQCYHLIDDRAPTELCTMKAAMAENPTLGPLAGC